MAVVIQVLLGIGTSKEGCQSIEAPDIPLMDYGQIPLEDQLLEIDHFLQKIVIIYPKHWGWGSETNSKILSALFNHEYIARTLDTLYGIIHSIWAFNSVSCVPQ